MYHYYLDRCEEVEWYDYEPFAIDYYLDDKIHSYIPDFLVKINNDKIEGCLSFIKYEFSSY